jgi:hypothetical protein
MNRSIMTFTLPFVLSVGVSNAGAQGAVARKGTPAGAAVAAATVPGASVLASARVTVTPAGGGAATTAPIGPDGRFSLDGLAPGRYRVALTTPRQTQGATFGEKVNAGLQAAGSAVSQGSGTTTAPAAAKHETAKNAIGNVRGRTNPNGGMPNRISMNVTIARSTQFLEVDGAPMDVVVGADGRLSGLITPR